MDFEFKDLLGRDIRTKFRLGGFGNDITICELYRKFKVFPGIKLFGMKPKYTYKKVYSWVTTDSMDVVSKYTEKDYIMFANRVIDRYNIKEVNKEKIEQYMNKINIIKI